MKQLVVTTRCEWREWLGRNYDKEPEVWLVFHKKHTGKPVLEYDAAVEEALCFGWIDSIIKKRDEETYLRKFTPRKPGSLWSELNKKRAEKMIKQGSMTGTGLAKIREAKKTGHWEKPARPVIPLEMPEELEQALAKNGKARDFFEQLAPSSRKQFIIWVAIAKRRETKAQRVKEAITLLEQGKKLGLK